MGNGNRPTRSDLRLEFGDHTAIAPENIAEAHDSKARDTRSLQGLAYLLGEALGGTHHVGGVDRFVGGDQHKPRHLTAQGFARHDIGTKCVVAHRLPRIDLLHQRYVLVRGGVEYRMWAVTLHDFAHPLSVLHIACNGDDIQLRISSIKFFFDLVE